MTDTHYKRHDSDEHVMTEFQDRMFRAFSTFRQNIDLGGIYAKRFHVNSYINENNIDRDALGELFSALDEIRNLDIMHDGLTQFFGDSVIASEYMTIAEFDDWALNYMLAITDDYVDEHTSFTPDELQEARDHLLNMLVENGVRRSTADIALTRFEQQIRCVSENETGKKANGIAR